jgi:hypothetical protein
MLNNNTNKADNKIYGVNGHVIGWIEGNSFCKRVKESTHMLRTPRGWAWDVAVLERAQKEGLLKTVIFEGEYKKIYQASLVDFLRYGVDINRGYGEQICLPIKYWTITQDSTPIAYQLELPI